MMYIYKTVSYIWHMNLYELSDENIKYAIKSAKDFFLISFFVLNRYDYSLPRYRRLKRIAISRFLNRPLTLDIWPTSSLAAVRLATDKRWVTSFLVSYLRTYVVLEGKIGHDTYLEIRRLFPHSRRRFSLSYSRTIRDIIFKRENVLKDMMYTGILKVNRIFDVILVKIFTLKLNTMWNL